MNMTRYDMIVSLMIDVIYDCLFMALPLDVFTIKLIYALMLFIPYALFMCNMQHNSTAISMQIIFPKLKSISTHGKMVRGN